MLGDALRSPTVPIVLFFGPRCKCSPIAPDAAKPESGEVPGDRSASVG